MPAPFVTRPGPDESAAYYQGYIAEVPDGGLIESLIAQTGETRGLLSRLTEEAAGRRYAPGKWSIKEVLGHILDSERVMGYRLLRIARGDATPLAGFDQDTYAVTGRFDRRPLDALLAEYAAVRAATIELIGSLDEEDLAHRGIANDYPVSARALAWIIAGHERHHLRVVRERYDLS
jgi:hypothetical protein